MNYLFLALVLASSIYAVYSYSLPAYLLKKNCIDIGPDDITPTCPPDNNAYAYLKEIQLISGSTIYCEINIICDTISRNRPLKSKVQIQILPSIIKKTY